MNLVLSSFYKLYIANMGYVLGSLTFWGLVLTFSGDLECDLIRRSKS